MCVCNSIPDPSQLTDKSGDGVLQKYNYFRNPIPSSVKTALHKSQCLVGCSCNCSSYCNSWELQGLSPLMKRGSLTIRHPRTILSRRARVCGKYYQDYISLSLSCQD